MNLCFINERVSIYFKKAEYAVNTWVLRHPCTASQLFKIRAHAVGTCAVQRPFGSNDTHNYISFVLAVVLIIETILFHLILATSEMERKMKLKNIK